MQARVKPDYRFNAVTAATVVFVKDEWRNVSPGWEDRLPDSYGDFLDFQDARPDPEPEIAPESGLTGAGGESKVVTANPEPAQPAASTPPSVDQASPEPVPAVEPDADLEAAAAADELEAAEAEKVAADLRATNATAAADVEKVAAEKRADAAAKRSAKKGSK